MAEDQDPAFKWLTASKQQQAGQTAQYRLRNMLDGYLEYKGGKLKLWIFSSEESEKIAQQWHLKKMLQSDSVDKADRKHGG